MNAKFYLRKPKSTRKTSILFSVSFKKEQKQFIYSIRKSILPIHWDFENHRPFQKGKMISVEAAEILNRQHVILSSYNRIKSQCEFTDTEFTSEVLRAHLNETLCITVKNNSFFNVLDQFIDEKIKLKHWSNSTIKRYRNIKKLLEEFEEVCNYKLTFSSINKKFYNEFTDFCYEYRNHFTNTFNRNLGLFKTFMYWALKNDFTFNKTFIEFEKPKRVLTRQEVLSLEDIRKIYQFEIASKSMRKIRDVFVFQCLTGMRYSELKLVNKRNIFADGQIFLLTEQKDITKPPREIPLVSLAREILEKYNYELPLIANQNQNESIKEILKELEFNKEVEYTRTKGAEQHKFVKKFYERISTHTARRSFITIMRNSGKPDKTIMSISGHRDIKSFNMYHQVDNNARISAVESVFGGI